MLENSNIQKADKAKCCPNVECLHFVCDIENYDKCDDVYFDLSQKRDTFEEPVKSLLELHARDFIQGLLK